MMFKFRRLPSTLFLLFIIVVFFSYLVKSRIFIYYGCSEEKFKPNTPFETNLNSLLSLFVSSSSQGLYNSFAIGNDTDTSSESPIYGLYQCRGDLRTPDCTKCIEGAVSQVGLACPYSYSGSLQLDKCLVRFEHFDFLGKLDTDLRFKKCSTSVSHDMQFLKRRDEVLVELGETNQGFRISSSSSIEGFSQCLGDLSPDDCNSCLGEAITKLKNLCGSSEAGDVFLAQCYMRYWISGYHDSPSESSGGDDVGKTIAIVIGVVAGLTAFIVLISFCRRSPG
ncbi:cysteine-rich repeat secretory protein 15 [Cynara cardunculus var. scolymus]|uniref:Gnk2-homologous domain-containing protein n=1 Tax=Cynara cardunculus var. scolymus TaxID=59895 RepID=A0A103XUL3_CYNCS|nr:cysteine-rich repeat secretory protein 15 [Cynara cardunculus var. scolymus]KVH97111.1 Gnk2-homologous domain-containing protein [Cynara cardunculus var. scolymus]